MRQIPKPKRHKHDYSVSSTCGKDITFKCSRPGCDSQRRRRGTPRELKIIGHGLDVSVPVHRVWHDFCSRFCKEDHDWKMTGHDLMEAVEEWACSHKGHVRVVGCDDDYHASSLLVLIEHKSKDQYMGTTVVFIPQCTGEKPIRFFLYPGHRLDLMTALLEIDVASRGPSSMEHVRNIERAVAVSKILP